MVSSERATPSFSICSCDISSTSPMCRNPAVSMNLNGIPSSTITSSMVSRVVPATGVTSAFSSPSNAFSNVDLPAFTTPAIATGTPFFITLPIRNESHKLPIRDSSESTRQRSSYLSANSTSSSAKSNSSSIREASSSNLDRNRESSCEKTPRIWFMASLWEVRFSEAIRSATASAWARSILPLRKARCENSPGPAITAPFSTRVRSRVSWMYSDPWHEISTLSSPVKEWGARKTLSSTWSRSSPAESVTCPK